MNGVVIDTNVFVAAGFNSGSAAARILAAVREGHFQLVWNKPTARNSCVVGMSASVRALVRCLGPALIRSRTKAVAMSIGKGSKIAP